MALDELNTRIALLLTSIEDKPEDMHELHELIRQKLAQLKAMGLPLPADMVELEKKLDADLNPPQA